MGFFRFRRSIKILPGIRWNLNKGGSSFTFGRRGYHYTVGNKGSRTTVGIPGTGISYTQVHSTGAKPQTVAAASSQPMSATSPPAKSKAGCFYAAGLTVLALWLLSFLSNVGTPTPSNPAASSASPVASAAPAATVANVPAVAPRYTPDPTLTALRATRVFSPAEEARLQEFVPPRVKLRRDVEFSATSRNAPRPSIYLGQGREVSVVRVVGPNLVVEYAGRQSTVPISKTDFLERVIAETAK